MTRERLYLFDTTLRDGAQTTGVDFSLDDKRADRGHARRARHRLCRGRLSRRQPARHAASSRPRRTKLGASFTAFGMTKRAGRSAANDPGIAALLDADADAICFVAKAWDYHVRVALGCTLEENLEGIRDSVAAARRPRPRGAARLRAFLRRLQGQSRLCARLRPGRATMPARAGWCCATPMAARCRTRSSASSARWRATSPATGSASTPMTTPATRSPNSLAAVARRRAADPGHAERPRRALRQRQPRHAHPDAER